MHYIIINEMARGKTLVNVADIICVYVDDSVTGSMTQIILRDDVALSTDGDITKELVRVIRSAGGEISVI